MHIIARIIAFTYIAVLMCTHPATPAGNALKQAAWSEMCATAKELRAVPGTAEQKLTAAQHAIEVLETTALKLAAVAHTQTDAGNAVVMATLAAELRSEATTVQQDVTELRKAALEATAAAAAVYGGISEFLTLLTAAQSGTANGCLADTDGSNVISGKSGLGDCPIDKAISLTDHSETLATTFTEAGISSLKTTDVKDTSTNANKCVLFQNAQSGTDRLFQKGTTFMIAGGALKVNSNGPTMTTANGQALAAERSTTGAKLITQAHAAIKELLSQAQTAPDDAAKTKVRALAADSHFAATVVKKLKQIGMQGSDNTLEAYTKSKIKKLLDDGGANFDSKWQALIDTAIYDGKSEKVKKEKASSITSTKELIQSVLYYHNKQQSDFLRLQKELEQKTNDCEKKPQTPKCDEKEEGECGTTKGCEWKNSTCKLTEAEQKEAEKAGQETGKDGKPTNTTGNNSFLIKKATLWLVVFCCN